ncbi:MAG TPA: DinB family protein [Candidatus Limnocylindria bacterium]|nr:DinB family protein [Candidatus Limnocylindria bacterium]
MSGAVPALPRWLTDLEAGAPDVVAAWRALDDTPRGLVRMRRELRDRVRTGDAPRLVAQAEAVADALAATLRDLPEALLRAPGGEEDWNVAQAFAHTTAARRFLASWAALDAGREAPEGDAPSVTPSVPGPPDATRDQLLTFLEKSRRGIAEAADRIRGHETQPCALDHPLVGRLRCGDWLVFVGVHDLMHLEQIHRLRAGG